MIAISSWSHDPRRCGRSCSSPSSDSRLRRDAANPPWCLNLVADEGLAEEEFLTPQGFHVAREALLARVVHGPA